ncbi:MAG TPA: T9SS type A sorting domain-containing protein, partial [Saprospiraceae bacterium]|nr:T9SS type A sorting domain-containing protein [Saprospiraceae bacterium]
VSALHDTLDAQGISTLDALMAAAHSKGIAALGTPYQIVAADANHDGVVDADDLSDMIRLVTGQTGKLPEHNSWVFLPADFVFPNPANPFASSLPENMSLGSPECYKNAAENFVAIKIGDVNQSWVPGQISAGSEDRQGETVTFTAPKIKVQAGEEIQIPITTPYLGDIAGFQFTLDFDPSYLHLVQAEPGLVPAAWMGVFPDEHLITGSWHSPFALDSTIIWKNERKTAMVLTFNVLKGGALEKMIQLNSAKTSAEAYTRKLSALGANLAFVSKKSGKENQFAFTVVPNPVRDEVKAAFFLESSGPVTARLTDMSGQVVQTQHTQLSAGYQEIRMPLSAGIGAGLLFLHIESAEGTGAQKVMVVR